MRQGNLPFVTQSDSRVGNNSVDDRRSRCVIVLTDVMSDHIGRRDASLTHETRGKNRCRVADRRRSGAEDRETCHAQRFANSVYTIV